MDRNTKRAFSRAVGKTFQIEAFDELGCAELDLTAKLDATQIGLNRFAYGALAGQESTAHGFRSVLMTRRKLDQHR